MTLLKQYSTGPNNAHNAYDQNPPTISKIRIVPITTNHRAKDISHTMAKWHHRLPVKTSSMVYGQNIFINNKMIIMRQATRWILAKKNFNTPSTFN